MTAATATAQDAALLEVDPLPAGRDATEPGPDASAAPARSRPRLRLLRYEPDSDEPSGPPPAPTPAPTPAGTRPEAVADDATDTVILRRRAEQVLRLTFEVLDGRRPIAQLTGHLEPRALRYVRAALPRAPVRLPARMTSLRIDRPCANALEVAAVYRRGPRARALAARFERTGTAGDTTGSTQRAQPDPRAWRCVVLRLL